MNEFKGFSEKTIDCLVGIRFNNNKEYFHSNIDSYRENVHKPIALLADYCYRYLNKLDSNFIQTPKISRANRDIRFSKNKNPYKESKWFFLRADGKPDIIYSRPTYFFEISPDWYRYGFFFSPMPKGMAAYRNKASADPVGFEKMISCVEKAEIFNLYGMDYKRKFSKDMSEKLSLWYNKKDIEIIHYGDYSDKSFYSSEIALKVCQSFKDLYPAYKYFESISW